jgi:MFS family permease
MSYQPPDLLELDKAAGEKPTAVRYQVLGWVCVLSMITYIDRVCIKQVGNDIQSALGISEIELGLAFSAFGLAYALFEVPSGWLGDRLGPRKVLTRIVLCWSLFTALTGCVWQFTLDSGYALDVPYLGYVPIVFNGVMLLILIRFLFGAGEAGAYPNIARALRNWFPYAQRGRAQGLLWAFGRWGGAIGPGLILFFATWLGWRGAFWAFGIMGALWVTCFAFWFRNTPAEHPGVNDAERELILGGRESTQPPPLSWATMLRSRSLWCLSLMYFCSNAGWCFFITWDKKFHEKVLHLADWQLLLASSTPLAFGGLACLLGGLLTDRQVRIWGRRWGRTLQGLVSYFLGGAFFALALLASSAGDAFLVVVCLCTASFLKDFAMAASWATCIDIGHRYSGTVAGFMNMVGNFGTFFSPIIVAHVAGDDNWQFALVYSSCMFFAAAAGWAFINPKRVIVYSPEDRRRLLAEGTVV